MAATNGFATRLGDGFALQMHRFQGPSDRSLWMLSAASHPSTAEPPVEMVADRKALLDLRRFADEALAALNTDGGRADLAKSGSAP